jgi:hypothetical protein
VDLGQRPLPAPPVAGARTEMALAVNAYNLKRTLNLVGARRLIELMG